MNTLMIKDLQNISRRVKHKKASKVGPGDDVDLIDEEVEMDEKKTNNKNKGAMALKDALKRGKVKTNPINMITNIKQGARRWKDYATTRRKQGNTKNIPGEDGENDRRCVGGQGLTPEVKSFDSVDSVDGVGGPGLSDSQREMRNIHNRNLIEYFARLGSSNEEDTCVNLEYIEQLLLNGANINCTDKYGQSVLHEASRAWDVDVARFLIDDCSANINHPDDKGRTPLHVASAVDYPEMVNFLIDANANKEALTKGENQTPVHFAARNDACLSLKALVKKGCQYKNVEDFKGRTPLHIAAELDRSKTARLLLELDDPAPAGVIDNSGQSAIVWMITKMPPVAKVALDQFHTTDRANRKQFYHLNWLEPRKPDDDRPVFPQTAMQVIIHYRQIDLVIHPVIARLIKLKWQRFGKLHAALSTILNLAFILMWTIQGMLVPYDEMHSYVLPSQWWRIVLFVIAFMLTIWQIKEELFEFYTSKRQHSHWRTWRKKELLRDMEFVHPRWPEEAQYLQQELEELDNLGPQYFNDFWNIFDWICYTLLFICVITHIVDVANHTIFLARLHIRLLAVTIILIWLRLMKNARAFSLIGPLIVIVGHMIGDCLKFLILYFQFYLPFACAFWMIFGGDKIPEKYAGTPDAINYTMQVAGMGDFGALAFTLFRLTLVDEYDYDGMKAVDGPMVHILLVSWFALSAILMLNLFIALLSDTFQRVYDNANANAVMQKAITILAIEEGLSSKRKQAFRTFIHEKCSPEKDFYDDDTTEIGGEDLKKVTFHIKDELEELRKVLDEHILPECPVDTREYPNTTAKNNKYSTSQRQQSQISVDKYNQDISDLQGNVIELMEKQDKLANKVRRDMGQIKALLQQIALSTLTGQGGGAPVLSNLNTSLMRRPPPSHMMGPSHEVDTARQLAVMPYGDLSTYTSMPSNVQRSVASTVSTYTPPTDEEWDNIEKNRRRDLKQLREKLSAEQKLTTSQSSSSRRRASIAEDATSLMPTAQDATNQDSSHTDTTVAGQVDSSDTMDRTLPKV